MKALLIVDVQRDFCPGGALAVPHGDRVIPVINRLSKLFPLVLASKDCHPPESIHFRKWPVHCVRDTAGAEFHPYLQTRAIKEIFLKGTDDRDDGYSAFEASNRSLKDYLQDHGVDELCVTGLATDYCVRKTVLDALNQGFRVTVVKDAVAGVEVNPGDVARAEQEMKQAGAHFVNSARLQEND